MDKGKKEEKDDGSTIIRIQPSLTCEKGRHFFQRISGVEIKCQKCPIGYPVSGGTEVKNGRVMIHGQLVI
jgi:hypothetical protein